MRDFIKKSLADALRRGAKGITEFDYQFKREDGDTISINGTLAKDGDRYLSDFKITRTKANGDRCSAVPVFGMPLIQKCIAEVAELAVENL